MQAYRLVIDAPKRRPVRRLRRVAARGVGCRVKPGDDNWGEIFAPSVRLGEDPAIHAGRAHGIELLFGP
jgi:hypothetical protein